MATLMEHYERQNQMGFLQKMGLTEADVKETFMDPGFSIHNFRLNILREAAEGNLREGTAETSFGQLLRVGVQAMAADYFAWAGTETIFQDIVDEKPSNKFAEFYAPMYGGQLPKPVERSGRYASSYFRGTDSMMVNEKFGRLYEFEKELWDDDKTGQIRQKAADIGQGMRIVQEMWFTARLLGTAMSYAEDIQVPAPPILGSGVYSTSLFGTFAGTSYGNMPSATGDSTKLSQSNLEAASIAMLKARDPMKNMILTKMDTLIVSVNDMFTAAKLINSTLQPSMPAVTTNGTSNTAFFTGGATGYVNTINPLMGLYKLKVSRYLPAYYWFLGQAKKGIIMQTREPLNIVQENPASGESFGRDVIVFKSSARWAMDWITGSNLFWYKGYVA